MSHQEFISSINYFSYSLIVVIVFENFFCIKPFYLQYFKHKVIDYKL